MRTRLALAASQSSAARLRTEGGADDDARAALTSWLLGAHVQVNTGMHAGAAAGWIDRDGNATYVYPEITGYYLQWLAWHAACHGANDDTRRRAAAAQRWLLSWACSAGSPATRVYLRPTEPDWRNSALFFFDLAMVMRGLASAERTGLIQADPRLVDRMSELLLGLVAHDGMFDACITTRGDAQLPLRWSTRRGAFLSKAASGVLTAAAQFAAMPRTLQLAAEATFAASLESMERKSHTDTHALLYGIEGALSLTNHSAAVAALPHIIRELRNLLGRSHSSQIPESLDVAGRMRLDILAQAIRAAALLLPERATQDVVGRMIRTLVNHIDPDLGIPFSPSELPGQYNCWTTMFAEQALFAAGCPPDEPLSADLHLYLV
jgi:hypothetical protein